MLEKIQEFGKVERWFCYLEVAEKAKEGYESDVSDLEEDDNIIDDMLQSDDNFSYSGNRLVPLSAFQGKGFAMLH